MWSDGLGLSSRQGRMGARGASPRADYTATPGQTATSRRHEWPLRRRRLSAEGEDRVERRRHLERLPAGDGGAAADRPPAGALGEDDRAGGGAAGRHGRDEVLGPEHVLVVHAAAGSVVGELVCERAHGGRAVRGDVCGELSDVRQQHLVPHPHDVLEEGLRGGPVRPDLIVPARAMRRFAVRVRLGRTQAYVVCHRPAHSAIGRIFF
mmetsp:Transcript_35683/g.119279  ORF Transcript_35683/g.119279 Transcript_35683/m.119279 type:complete len:208 (-) Transcript_35683:5-628(-)